MAELRPQALDLLDQELAGEDGVVDRARRRQVDARIVDILRADGFQGPRYQKAIERLTQYGYLTMTKWTISGEVFRKARQVGRPVPLEKASPVWSPEDRQGVVVDSVLGGLRVFHTHGLVQGRWSAAGGANLDTYFVGAVLRAFPRIYIRWYDSHRRGQAELAVSPCADDTSADPFSLVPDQRATDPAHHAESRDILERLLPLVKDPQLLEALGFCALGYTQAEAARRVGLTEKALERRISRLRGRVNRRALVLAQEEGEQR
ncbi:hypothetical protein ACIBUY_04630 [Streptomyces sp. NPDC050085]|uniref:hypothetical protein n=1 Tax=Streptomyces sp. NPDC050085 TaxID=3365600 RepID=UPI0037B108E4